MSAVSVCIRYSCTSDYAVLSKSPLQRKSDEAREEALLVRATRELITCSREPRARRANAIRRAHMLAAALKEVALCYSSSRPLAAEKHTVTAVKKILAAVPSAVDLALSGGFMVPLRWEAPPEPRLRSCAGATQRSPLAAARPHQRSALTGQLSQVGSHKISLRLLSVLPADVCLA